MLTQPPFACLAAQRAMRARMEAGEGDPEKTDEELLAEAMAEEKKLAYNKHTDPEAYNNPLVKKYVNFANFNGQFVRPNGVYEPKFSGFIIMCIMVAGVLVGMQTYDQFSDHPTVNAIDNMILYIFTFEIFVKVWSEGTAPWRYADTNYNPGERASEECDATVSNTLH